MGLVALAVLLVSTTTLAPARPRDPFPYPTPLWVAAQLVPSPEWIVSRGDVTFGLRWQVTPALFAFGLRRGLNPWRAFVAEPVVRYGGSIELFVAPEFIALPGDAAQQWGLRSGLRAHLPLSERGENLAVFAGASHLLYRAESSVGFEAGACVLYGLLGAQVTYSPRFLGADAWTFTLRLRYL
jgi:hypothetical protein